MRVTLPAWLVRIAQAVNLVTLPVQWIGYATVYAYDTFRLATLRKEVLTMAESQPFVHSLVVRRDWALAGMRRTFP